MPLRSGLRLPAFSAALLAAVLLLTSCDRARDPSEGWTALRDGWEYCWGEAPADVGARARWLQEPPGGGGWTRYDAGARPANSEGHRSVWFRMHLPGIEGTAPTLFVALQRLRISFEVVADGRAVYRSGERLPAAGRPALWYVVSLPDSSPGQVIGFRVASPGPGLIDTPVPEIVFGPSTEVHAKIVRQGVLSFAFGALFVAVGLYSFCVHWKRRSEQLYLSFPFGLMSISAGGMMLIGCELNQIYLYYGTTGWYLHIGSMLLFPVGLWAHVEHSIGAGWRRFVRRFWQFHIGYAAVALAADVTGVVPFYPKLLHLWFLLLLIECVAFVPLLVQSVRRGQRTARLFGAGLGAFTLGGLFDILSGLEVIPVYWDLFPWGLAVLIGFLFYIQEDAFSRAQRRLREYSEALEAQTGELRLHRDRLEDLVGERTRELEGATASAQAAKRAKTEFLAHMSHELRTPLNGILGYAQILRREDALPKRVMKGLGVIQDSGEHLLAMINDVLDLAKVEAGRLELVEGTIRLDELLDLVTARQHPKWLFAEMGGLKLQFSIPEPPVVAPPREDLEALYDLARVGDVMGVEARLEPLRRAGGYEAFTERVTALAEDFDVSGLQAFLSQGHVSHPADDSQPPA